MESMTRLLTALLLAAAVAIAPAAPALADAPGDSPNPCNARAALVVISDIGFFPADVSAGKPSTVVMRAWNCAAPPLHAFATWTAKFVSDPSSSTVPTGCATIDPFVDPLSFGSFGSAISAETFTTSATCTANQLRATVTITNGLGTLAVRSTDLIIHH